MNRLFRLSGLLGPATVGVLGIAAIIEMVGTQSTRAAEFQNSPMLVSVKPTDGSFQSIKSLVKRYGCVVPNQAFNAIRPTTRYALAMALEVCLDEIGDQLSKEDLEAVERLKTEFRSELAILKAKTGTLAAQTKVMEANQFSSKTGTQGEVGEEFQLPYVSPIDESFKALRSLVNRYDCFENATENPFKPIRSVTRYELAAALNVCIDKTGDRYATTQDRETVQLLKKELASELTTLNNRVDPMKTYPATLEAQQFSTDTRTHGEVAHGFQFQDVRPTDWAYQSLQSLVERTGCLDGKTALFEPNRATTRNELARGLNACLNAMGSFDTKADQKTAQALQKEFKSELNSINERVNLLNSQTEHLKSKQFSTTTKIQGQVVFSFQGGGFR